MGGVFKEVLGLSQVMGKCQLPKYLLKKLKEESIFQIKIIIFVNI